MPRDRTGAVEAFKRADGSTYYRARIRLGDGTRERVDVPEKHSRDDATRRLYAAAMQEREDEKGEILAKKRERAKARASAPSASTPGGEGESCATWWNRYLEHRETKGQTSVPDARGRVTRWVLPELRGKTMRTVAREDLERIVRLLDAAVGRGDLAWKTAGSVWGEVTSAFGAARASKVPELRVRDDNPCEGVTGPDRGVEKSKPILYPDEAIALLACERVPLYRRRAYAVAIYTAGRANELAALTAADVDIAHARVSIAKQVDRGTGDERSTKTRRARSFDVEPALLPLLELLTDARPVGRLLHLPPDEDRAELLRADLRTAGVEREELFVEGDPARLRIVFHNLRDTGLTWMAVRGDDPMRIQWRGGHTDFKMTQAYIAAGKNLGGGFGSPFPPLPSSLLADIDDRAKHQAKRLTSDRIPEKFRVFWRPQRELNAVESGNSRGVVSASREDRASRDDVNTRTFVGVGPSVGPSAERTTDAPPVPRASMIARLASEVVAAVEQGDLEGARIAHDAMGRLLASAATAPAGVVELAAERAKRGGS